MPISDWIDFARMDELGRMDTPVHRIDARAKVLVTLTYVVLVMSFSRYEIAALIPFLLYPVLLAAVGRIPAKPILKKMLIAAPVALLVGLFNPFLDREPITAIGSFELSGGWISFLSILIRFALTVGAVLIIMACTGLYRLGRGMEQLGVPRVFVIQLLFLYRYLFVISDEAIRILRAVALRSNGVASLRLPVYGSLTGQLMLRSMDRADRIYRAMLARGFDGEIRLPARAHWRLQDTLFVCISLICLIGARVWNPAELLGRWWMGTIS